MTEPSGAEIVTRLDELTDLFRRRLLDDRTQRMIIAQLADRAEHAERRADLAFLRPLVMTLARVIDRMDDLDDPDGAVGSLIEEISDGLALYGIHEIGGIGAAPDPRAHEIGTAHGRAAGSVMIVDRLERRGWRSEEVVIRPARAVARFVPEPVDADR